MAILLIEHIEAVNHIDEILSVPGIDLIFVGPGDLSASMGLLGQATHTRVEEAIQKVHAEPFYEVSDAHLGTEIEMEGGRPKVVGKGSEFKCENQRIYFFNQDLGTQGGKGLACLVLGGKRAPPDRNGRQTSFVVCLRLRFAAADPFWKLEGRITGRRQNVDGSWV